MASRIASVVRRVGSQRHACKMLADSPAEGLLAFINKSHTHFHAVDEASKALRQAGFEQVSERRPWDALQPGGRYFFTRNGSTLVAFAIGGAYVPGNGFYMVGAHTDRRGI